MRIVDRIYQDFCLWVRKTEFLKDVIVFRNIICSFNFQVCFHSSFVSICIPGCFPDFTQGRGFQQSLRGGSGRSLARKAKHFILRFDRFLSLLNFRLCFPAYSSQIFNISWGASIEGARNGNGRLRYPQFLDFYKYVPITVDACNKNLVFYYDIV